MTAGRAALTNPVALLGRAVRYTEVSLRAVRASDLSRGTPCSEWSLRDLVLHMDDSMAALEEAMLDQVVVLSHHQRTPSDPVAALLNRACRLMSSWEAADHGSISVGGAPLPSGVAAAAGALDVAVHGWDVAQAIGRPRPIPDALADELWCCAELFVTDADRPGRFGPPIPVPHDAGPGEKLLAFLGR